MGLRPAVAHLQISGRMQGEDDLQRRWEEAWRRGNVVWEIRRGQRKQRGRRGKGLSWRSFFSVSQCAFYRDILVETEKSEVFKSTSKAVTKVILKDRNG